MSYSTWHVYGYGIEASKIDTTPEKIEKLLEMAPETKKIVEEQFKKHGIENPTFDDYEEFAIPEYECQYFGGAPILQYVIKELEGITFDIADDYNCNIFLLYCPGYPWYFQLHPEEVALTEKDIANIIRKYVSVLTDEPIDIDYQSVENGG